MILVVIEAADPDRASEGLRAGLGLGLRGDDVAVVLTGPAARFAGEEQRAGGDARIARALRTLAELGRPAEVVPEGRLAERMRVAQAVEVWTSRGPDARRLEAGGHAIAVAARPPRFRRIGDGAAIDGADLVAQILGSDGPVVVR